MFDIKDLAKDHCTPLKGKEHQLSRQEIEQALRHFPEWKISDTLDAISRTYSFDNYYQTMAFVNALAYVAHQQDHHPDLSVHYDKCIVHYSTHDVGGISKNDLICAAKADALFTE